MNNLEAAEDALATFYANARISKNLDKEQEASLIASVNHAKAEIQKFNEDKASFFERYKAAEFELLRRHQQELIDHTKSWQDEGKRLGYDN